MDDLSIRLATPEDMPELMEMAFEIFRENSFLDGSAELILSEFWPALHQDHGLCGIVGPQSGRIEGFVLLRIGTMWYSHAPCVEEKVLAVGSAYRAARGGRANRLCAFSKQVADALGLPLIIGVLSNHRTEGKLRMYQRHFGAPAGAFFLYQAHTGGHDVAK